MISIGRIGQWPWPVILAIGCAAACADRPLALEPTRRDTVEPAPATDAEIRAALDELNQWENETREATDFAAEVGFERRSGTNPHAVVAVGDLAVGVLRGTSEIVLLDGEAAELSRLPAPPSPVDLAVDDGHIYVAGSDSTEIWIYGVGESKLFRESGIIETGLLAPRSIAARGGRVFVADDASGQLVMFHRPGADAGDWKGVTLASGHGPTDLEASDNHLAAVYSLDHELRVWRLEGAGARGTGARSAQPIDARIRHDGPIWSVAIRDTSDGAIVALTGIEDRPLDRSDEGSFGYIDSYAFVYRVNQRSAAERLAAINISEHRLVTGKWLELELGETPRLRLGSYGGDRSIEITFTDASFAGDPAVTGREMPPGTTAIARVGGGRAILANPLLDGWLVDDGRSFSLRAERGEDPRTMESRIGEQLFFTSLMAPWGESTAKRSRFTCEACHVEGYGDGRTHFTGRDDVIATSRPLRGLFNNRPHFTRALDETTTEMVDNEFGVANKLNGRSPWFELRAADFFWLSHLGSEVPEVMSPIYLRRSLMLFLRDFTHTSNPYARHRQSLDASEKRGAELFLARCESCHSARLVADDEASAVPFAAWPAHIFERSGVIVWGRSGYEKTGVKPYVHAAGARPPTLRRLYKKWPYFTNGSAKTLATVLEQVRFDPASRPEGFSHAGGAGTALARSERDALLAFLKLL